MIYDVIGGKKTGKNVLVRIQLRDAHKKPIKKCFKFGEVCVCVCVCMCVCMYVCMYV